MHNYMIILFNRGNLGRVGRVDTVTVNFNVMIYILFSFRMKENSELFCDILS